MPALLVVLGPGDPLRCAFCSVHVQSNEKAVDCT
ncbi:hypothetical protein ACDW_16200 [Acidovorax sp. DW039]|nr:hypothetical protein ACDW_16200 [Acidovorax sp. DW039]